jgi:protein-S-isoprenylcysteine O-methyltransferase Ste14
MKNLYIGLIWATYCVIHSYLISIRFADRMKKGLKDYYAFYRLFYVILSFILLVPVAYFTQIWGSPDIFSYGAVANVIRYILMTTAVFIFVKAFFMDYDLLTFTGIRQMMQFRKNNKQPQGEIKKTGLLGIVRHPLYLAVIIFIWCNTFSTADIVINSVLTIFVFLGTLLEEQKLVLEFGDSYIQYKKEVPMIVPFLKC